MIPRPHTIIDPRAVMIKPVHTFVAYVAMPTSWCPDNLTLGAQGIWVELFNEGEEVYLRVRLYITWVPKPTNEESNERKQEK
jgi:hypothetical protein